MYLGIVGGTGKADKAQDGLDGVTFLDPPFSNSCFVG
jgi:hypothetical protein